MKISVKGKSISSIKEHAKTIIWHEICNSTVTNMVFLRFCRMETYNIHALMDQKWVNQY